MNTPEKFEIRETIDNVPVKFTIYPAGARIGNDCHSFMSPAEGYTFFIVGDIDTTGMTDAEFFRSPLAVFEGCAWTGYDTIDTYEYLLDVVRCSARRDIAQRLPYVGKLELESIAQAGQIEALEAQVHELRQAICFTYGYLEFNLDMTRPGVKRLLNRLYDAAHMERLTNIEYFYDADEAALLPGGDAGCFPEAHPRPTLDGEFDAWLDTLHEDAPRLENAGGGNPAADLDAPAARIKVLPKSIKPRLTSVPTTCQCVTCENVLPVLGSAQRLAFDGGFWYALKYNCPHCEESGEDFVLVKAISQPAPTQDEEIAALVGCIRQQQQRAEDAAAAISAFKDRLEPLLAARGENWSDDDGYARLVAPSVRVAYPREELDKLVVKDPAQYGWLATYRKESPVAGRVMVK